MPDPVLPLADTGISKSETRQRSWSLRRLLFAPLVVIPLFIGGVIGMYFQPPGIQRFFAATGLQPGGGTDTPMAVAISQVQRQEQVAVFSEGDVVALGRIIPRGDVITVATPFGASDARLSRVLVAEGDTVEAGQVLAELDNRRKLDSALQTALANVAVSRASLDQTRAQLAISRDEARAALERAQATAAAADADLARATSLLERGVTTRAAFDEIQARAIETARDVEQRSATLTRYAEDSALVAAEIAVAEAALQAALAEQARAEADLETSVIRAPVAGRVLKLNARIGERPDGNGLLTLGDTTHMTVEAEVYQTLIGRVAIGDPVSVTAEALPGTLAGQVAAIGIEIGRQSITSDDPVANTDARVVDVIIALDDPSSAAAQSLTNLEVLVTIDAGRAGQ